ncbi:MAG: 4Fe-4S binding protein [Methanomethylovorans sp.]|nr:4Fe-4S binding protein [Methanomethylovorans sp.]
MVSSKGYIVVSGCKKCGRCKTVCPNFALKRTVDDRPKIDHDLCDRCMLCVRFCPNKALIYIE